MIRTLPELARAWWTLEAQWPIVSSSKQLRSRPLVPAYRVPTQRGETAKLHALARIVNVLADRLARLPRAWTEWDTFDPGAFFDLYPEQVEVLVSVYQTRHQVQVTVYADVLMPAFQEAEIYWTETVVPALHVAQPALFGRANGHTDPASETWARLLAENIGPEMEQHLYRAAQEIQRVRDLLYEWGVVDFLVTSAAREERYRVARSHNGHVDARTWKRLQLMPTLTLQLTFTPQTEEVRLRRRALLRWQRRPWGRSHAK